MLLWVFLSADNIPLVFETSVWTPFEVTETVAWDIDVDPISGHWLVGLVIVIGLVLYP